MAGLKPHWLRPEETTKVIETIDETLTQQIKMVLQSFNQKLSEEGGRLSDEDVSDFVNLAKHKIPTNSSGNGLEPQVLQSLKLVMEMMKQKARLEKKLGKEFLPRFQELALEAIKNNKSPDLNVAIKLILTFANRQSNDPEFEKKCQKFMELALKFSNDPDSLDKQEKLEFVALYKQVLGTIKADLEEKLKKEPKEETQQALDDVKELSKQVEVWEGGVLVDIEEGVFAMGLKTKVTVSGMLAAAEVSPAEMALEKMGIIHILADAINEAGAIFPSMADNISHGPTPLKG